MPRPFRSPLVVFATPLCVAFLWACVYDSAVGQPVPASSAEGSEAAVDERDTGAVETREGTDASDGDDESVDDIRAADDDVVRSAPRVRHSRPEGHTLGVDIAIEDRDGSSMRALHAALRRAERGEGQARLVFYGASHVASDLFTGVVRSRLQARFGDAGHGFVMPVAPWRSYRHQGVRIRGDEGGWESAKVRGDTRDIERFGLHGVFVETARRNAWAEVSTAVSRTTRSRSSGDQSSGRRASRGGGFLSVSFATSATLAACRSHRERVTWETPLVSASALADGPPGSISFWIMRCLNSFEYRPIGSLPASPPRWCGAVPEPGYAPAGGDNSR